METHEFMDYGGGNRKRSKSPKNYRLTWKSEDKDPIRNYFHGWKTMQ